MLLESAPDAMVIVDHHGRIVFVNGQTEQLFGYSRDELLGSALEGLIPERFQEGHVRHRRDYEAAPRTRPMGVGCELYARRKSGEEFPAEISLSPIDTAEGRLVVSAIRDISARKHAEAEHARLIDESAAHAHADRLKDEFLATLSHELRTPLNAILGWTALLRQGGLESTRAQHALATIERNARLQAQLMEDLLDISRVIRGKLHLELVPIDLVRTADAAMDVVRPSATVKQIHLELVAEQRPILLLADPDRLQQVFWNLLANAIKFTPDSGRVELGVRTDATSVTIVVRDTGKGIDARFLPWVFDRFRQEDSSTTRTHGGLGLGLAIVRSVVEAHGGTVSATSAGPGCGSTFTIVLPLVSAVERRRVVERARHAHPDALRGVRILVVDDRSDERDLFAAILGQRGAVVEAAEGVDAALRLLEQFQPAVIVCDIAMPERDGYELARLVRAHPYSGLARTPIVAVTANARAKDRRRALSAGFQRYVSKPLNPEELVETISALLVRPLTQPEESTGA